MAVPKRKTSPSRKRMRRGHDALKPANVTVDQTSGEQKRRHHVSLDGYYNGTQVTEGKVKP